MNEIARYDNGSISGCSEFTKEGFLKCDAIVTRTGIFLYQNPDGTVRRELRHPEDVLNYQSLNSMKMIPVTNDHPPERLVNAENSKQLSVGYTGENIKIDGRYVFSNFVVTDSQAINDIVNNGKKCLSLGYTVDLIEEPGEYEGQVYDYRQTNIKYNHLSIVDSARAGVEARIPLDRNDAIEISESEEAKMAKRKVKVDQEELLVEPEVAETIESLLERAKDLAEAKEQLESELSEIKSKLEKALAERDNARDEASNLLEEKKEIEEKMDSKKIDLRVKERLSLFKVAESVLDSAEGLEDLTDIQIKKRIIQAVHKKANLDGKPETYVNARFDVLLEDMKEKVIIGKTETIKGDASVSPAEEARKNMISRFGGGK